jgi:hypothetical protein
MPAFPLFCCENPGISSFAGCLAACSFTWLFYMPAKPGCGGLLREIDA